MENTPSSFIQRIGQRLWGEKTALPTVIPASPSEEIPRYPPFMKGLPAASVDRILSTQTELIQAIEQALALPDALYQTIALPVMTRYAAFSHLLPASESHHHRGAGGLFRHGLEVAHWATLAAQGCLFAADATPSVRKGLELRWRLAVCFAGLLHDIGKPVSDMAVVDSQGRHTWNPCDENLTEWAAQHHIERYFLRWRENRHKRHEQFSALVIERVLTRESRAYLLEPGPDIMQAMLETIHGLDRGSKLYELVVTADCKSVERDLKAHVQSVDVALGMPVEKYLFDAMRRLLKSGQWAVNEKGARLWRFQEGLHIVWRSGAQDIVSLLAKDKVPGIPRDEDTLADILIERGLAIPKVLPDGRQFRYWRMQPVGLDAVFYLLRLTSIESIFSNEPPVAIEGIEVGAETEAKTPSDSGSPEQTRPVKASPMTSAKASENKATKINFKPPAQEPTPQQLAEAVEANPDLITDVVSQDWEVAAEPLQAKPDGLTTSETKNVAVTQAISEIDKTTTKSTRQEQALPVDNTAELTADPHAMARQWLKSQGQAGAWLLEMTSLIHQGEVESAQAVLIKQGKCLLPFPETPQKLKVESDLFIQVLAEKGWLVTDLLSPMRKVQTINQKRVVQLATEPAEMMQILMMPAGSDQTTDGKQSEQPKTKAMPSKSRKAANGTSQMNLQVLSTPSAKPATSAMCSAIDSTDKHAKDSSKAVNEWLQSVRSAQSAMNHAQPDSHWQTVSDDELFRYLDAHPELQRYDFLRDISQHSDCQVIGRGQGIKVRIKP
ncbi:TraI domain-containing protein [Methylicorpusculum oleiharenae]|uniref:MobH family relaxase n=1 Tax=Methylicorpusculum oleiharenae TaxID=1338687 RepID=UPI00135C75C0|nr:MobH family relaxase [Methylicorpusculum oleiharenae]MCD2450434.1 TraI domain-containing protein [Methylicorpusculum oleiharenae]